VTGVPFQVSCDCEEKLVPVAVRVNAGPSSTVVDGFSDVRVRGFASTVYVTGTDCGLPVTSCVQALS